MFDNLSVAENLFVNAQPTRGGLVNWSELRARATTILRELGADFDADVPAGRLSIAQKHVVQIARALTHESRVLIFDEPTASLSQRECAELFRDRAQACATPDARCSSSVTSSKRYSSLRIAMRCSAMECRWAQGRSAMSTSDELIRLMVGRPVEQLFPKADRRARQRAAASRRLVAGRRIRRCLALRCARGEILGLSTAWWAPGAPSLRRCCSAINAADSGSVDARGCAAAGMAAGARRPAEARAQCCHSPSPRTSRCPIWPRSRRAAGAALRANRSWRASG